MSTLNETTKLVAANEVVKSLVRTAEIERRKNGFYVSWICIGSMKQVTRRWQTRGQSFYSVWHDLWPAGGTSMTALSQLVRWCGGKPVLPISTWQYWASERVKLIDPATVEVLRLAGYPELAKCVLCKQDITVGMDWWSLDGVTGPCCGPRNGCKQEINHGRV